MKKISFLGVSLLSVMFLHAQNQSTPIVLPNWGVRAISSNGEYAAGINFSAKLYNLVTGQVKDAGNIEYGLGNFLSDKGGMVGNTENGTAYVYLNGGTFAPQSLFSYWFCNVNAITPDETRICGTINNTKSGGVDYVPFYCDIDANGNIGEPQILPYPTEDFTGSVPQFASALYISADGKTILGEINDNYGYYDYPIIYTQDNAGNWSYSLPTADLFNPNHVEFPPNPWNDEPYYPEYTDFMNPVQREAYEQAMANISVTGIIPEPADYMTQDQLDAYNKAAETYNEWYYGTLAEQNAYKKVYFDVINQSYEFPLNEIVLSPDGTKFTSTSTHAIFGGPLNQVVGTESYIYIHDLTEEKGSFVKSPSEWIQPSQILNDGTVLAAYPINVTYSNLPTDSFIITQGSDEIIPILDYWQETNPEYAEWAQKNIEDGTGYVITNSDMSIFIGSLDEFNYDSYKPGVFQGMAAASYILGIDPAGVETIIDEASDYKVFNLQGVNVMNTKDKNELQALPAGIYIVNGKKVLVSK